MKKNCLPEHIRFSRLIMSLLLALYALFGFVEGMYAVLLLTLSTLLLGSNYSISTFFLKFLNLFGFAKIFKSNPRYQRSFCISREMEVFEESIRFIVGSLCVLLFFIDFHVFSMVLAFFMSVMMLISANFGFCISGLFYIGYLKVIKKQSHV